MNGLIQNFLQNMDEDQAKALLDQLDEEQVGQAIEWLVDETVVPQLQDIKQRAGNADDPMVVRRQIESLDEQTKEDLFYDTLDELVATMVLCRERPREGFKELKTMLRDPWTVESLLLIFENDEHIDPEYSDQMKDFGAEHIHWVGAMVIPEAYTDQEIEEVLDTIDMDTDHRDNGQHP